MGKKSKKVEQGQNPYKSDGNFFNTKIKETPAKLKLKEDY